jgi:hypothetical protein
MTDQAAEILKVGDQELFFDFVLPLESYFEDRDITPEKHWKLTSLMTNLHRGYCCTWEVKGGSFYLAGISAYIIREKGMLFWKKREYEEATVQHLFPEAREGMVKASWFSGLIRAQTWTRSNPIDDELELRIKDGNVVQHQWYHIDRSSGKAERIPYEKSLV